MKYSYEWKKFQNNYGLLTYLLNLAFVFINV